MEIEHVLPLIFSTIVQKAEWTTRVTFQNWNAFKYFTQVMKWLYSN